MADPLTSAAMLGLGVAGSAVSAGTTLMSGNAQADALNSGRFAQLLAGKNRQTELEQAANTTLAASQRQAMEASRNKEMMLSKARAAAGASGGGAMDTSVINTMAGVEQMGEFQKAMLLFGGLDRAAGLRYEADNAWKEAVNNDAATQYQAGMTRYKAKTDAIGTILGGVGTAFGKYGGEVFGTPKSAVEASDARAKATQAYADRNYQQMQREIERKQAESDRAWRAWVNKGGSWG
ncbi:hypothetical protein AMST5_00706 [freshwater sediment metagenome]|uniref:Uncharacterized protein n=1 Tax=freshwater sediment metagenome TaxID=556182 RepID=A0AA48M143_9ZZZZ